LSFPLLTAAEARGCHDVIHHDAIQEEASLKMLKHFRWNEVEVEHLNPLLERQLVTGEGIMIARLLLRKGARVPKHSHSNEQITNVIQGSLQFVIEGKQLTLRSGEVLCIPPHMPHQVLALEDTVALDTFYPPRQDWLEGNDDYLRQATPATEAV
jgi:quercetin dioxygenase-like cupin family protein